MSNFINVIYRAGDNLVAGKKVTWENRELLSSEFQEANVLAVHIEHEQDGQTNVLQFSGHDCYYIKYIGNAGLMVRSYGVSNPGLAYAKTWFLRLNGQQDVPVQLPSNMVNQAGAGMNVQLMGYDWRAADYDTLCDIARNFDLNQCELIQ